MLPADSVLVHNTGDPSLPGANSRLTWPVYQERDLSDYGAWRNWLGFFALELSAPFVAVYDEKSDIGMVRVFPSDVARGVKLFGFGAEFGDEEAYTDDNTQYIEMWGGLTPTFWDYAVLDPSAMISWEEQWLSLIHI